jgi:hypothetical protein
MSINARSEVSDELVLDSMSRQMQSRWDYKAAKVVSSLFSPPVVIAAAVMFLGVAVNAWKWSLAYLVSVILVPTIYVVWLLKTHRISNFHMYDRMERFKPMIVTIIMTVLAWISFKVLSAPAEITLFAFVGIFQVLLLLVITLFWKISIHATAISGLTVFLVGLFGWSVAYVLLCIPLVAWARIHTKNHTFHQILFGVLAGGVFITLVLMMISFQCKGAGLLCE